MFLHILKETGMIACSSLDSPMDLDQS